MVETILHKAEQLIGPRQARTQLQVILMLPAQAAAMEVVADKMAATTDKVVAVVEQVATPIQAAMLEAIQAVTALAVVAVVALTALVVHHHKH